MRFRISDFGLRNIGEIRWEYCGISVSTPYVHLRLPFFSLPSFPLLLVVSLFFLSVLNPDTGFS